MNEQFRDCVNRMDFYDCSVSEELMSVIVSDVDNDIDISYKQVRTKRNIIMIAARYNKIELLKLVLSKYAVIVSVIIDDCGYNEHTAIILACYRGYHEIEEL